MFGLNARPTIARPPKRAQLVGSPPTPVLTRGPVTAATLRDALVETYKTNPVLTAARDLGVERRRVGEAPGPRHGGAPGPRLGAARALGR